MNETNIIEQFELLLNAFKYVGWVNGITPKQYKALNKAQEYLNKVKPKRMDGDKREIANNFRAAGLTIREIAKIMGYKHPGSISHLLNNEQNVQGSDTTTDAK